MKLTPRAQGHRFRRPCFEGFGAGYYIDVRKVGRGTLKRCVGIDKDGREVLFCTDDSITDWEHVCKHERKK